MQVSDRDCLSASTPVAVFCSLLQIDAVHMYNERERAQSKQSECERGE